MKINKVFRSSDCCLCGVYDCGDACVFFFLRGGLLLSVEFRLIRFRCYVRGFGVCIEIVFCRDQNNFLLVLLFVMCLKIL